MDNQPPQHVFHFEQDQENFEDHAIDNGSVYWYASKLMTMLGYQSLDAFRKAINKATQACMSIDISVADNFIQIKSVSGGDDYKLTRFACYLTAMNADSRKPQVAAAQAYFAALAESFRQSFQEADSVERVLIRDEVSTHEKTLSSVAKQAGVEFYPFFQNSGYLGMYNMNLSLMRSRRGIPEGKTPLDFMGKTELAGNLFRITQTEEKIKNEKIRGQHNLEQAAKHVGQEVRKAMMRLGGTAPEKLPLEGDIKKVRQGLKTTQKEFAKLDSKKSRKKLKP